MKKLVTAVLAATVAGLAISAFAGAAPRAGSTRFGAKLTAKAVVPPQKWKNPTGSGSFSGEVVGRRLKWLLEFSGLSGLASADIRVGAAGTAGPVVVPLCKFCIQPLSGTSVLSKALLKDLKAKKLYLNVETKKNPSGEIRGQLLEG